VVTRGVRNKTSALANKDEEEDYGEDDEEEDEEDDMEDNMEKDTNYVSMAPSQQQLTEVSFENNKFGRYSAIMVDGEKYRYRIHRRNKEDSRRWYRCVSRRSVNCRATACYNVADKIITELSTPHNHSPPVFLRFVRYRKHFHFFSSYYW
jgi:hypothetical protein